MLAGAPVLEQLDELKLILANGTWDFIEALIDRNIQDLTIQTGYGTTEDWIRIIIENGVVRGQSPTDE